MDISDRGRALRVGEVAERLGKNRSWVQRAITGGELPGYRFGGRDFTVFERDLEAYVASRLVSGGVE